MSAGTYQLIDFGAGRKLESLGGYLVDRPSPAAEPHRRRQRDWSAADARFDADRRRWTFHRPWPEAAELDCGSFVMPIQPTPFGHIGIFPEQHANWKWLRTRVQQHREEAPLQALNLFGYTGASSLAVATAGGKVAHVDAAKPNVMAARRAADRAGCDQSIRFLTDDAGKFVARELRRQRQYDLIILDPPAYGHGPRGKAWRLERDLWPLLQQCLDLLTAPVRQLLLTGHSEQVGSADVTAWLRRQLGSGVEIAAGRSGLPDTARRKLDCGFYVRAVWEP
ncbi:class I SAM-dependent methyltransferase [Roseimaritima ulvae]|uniref:23S rRNA m(2)G2445 methyltransferase n=1 Tax=Roseimaritima ulvae TaxID=980254 RepID=A0A5B9QWS9_9BACT|nr:class I SAM-dependent methyltransferase [Roseimaritima ulvae]QEG41566.1 23S rRNA m(2)G2445 methyltransferase [Roseimaritima ulvae]